MVKETTSNFYPESVHNTEIEARKRLATAIARRSLDEQKKTNVRIAELTGFENKPVNPLLEQALLVVNTELTYKFLEDPSIISSSDYHEIVNVIFNEIPDKMFAEMAKEMQKDEEEQVITGSQLRTLSKAFAESALQTYFADLNKPGSVNIRLKEIDEAKKMAAERNLDPDEIFADENLWSDLIRRTSTAESHAESGANIADKFTTEAMIEMFLNTVPTVDKIISEIEDESYSEDDEIDGMKKELREDPNFQLEADRVSNMQRVATRTITIESIVRFWGQEGLDSLPDDLKVRLGLV